MENNILRWSLPFLSLGIHLFSNFLFQQGTICSIGGKHIQHMQWPSKANTACLTFPEYLTFESQKACWSTGGIFGDIRFYLTNQQALWYPRSIHCHRDLPSLIFLVYSVSSHLDEIDFRWNCHYMLYCLLVHRSTSFNVASSQWTCYNVEEMQPQCKYAINPPQKAVQ